MKRSAINHLIRSAGACFQNHGWTLPANARWDVTDFGLGDWRKYGLVLVNLAEEPEYCEKLMYAEEGMTTPAHTHRRKKEDIICRWGRLAIQLWPAHPNDRAAKSLTVQVDREPVSIASGSILELAAGSRVTLVPGIYHEFYPLTSHCIIGEVSTANDDLTDNVFVNPEIGRYPGIEEDETAQVRLVSERSA